MPGFSLSVVIPAYNEKARLPATLDMLVEFFKDPAFDAEIVVSDDGSADDTYAIAQSYAEQYQIIRALTLKKHLGKGGALALGVQDARKDWVLLYDADAAIPIAQIRDFMAQIRPDSQVLIGSRDINGSRLMVKQPWLRHRLGRLFVQFRKTMVGLKDIEDTQCGFKLIRTPLAKKIFADMSTFGFLYDVEILGRARLLGAPIQELGIQWRHVDQSKVNVRRELPRILKELMQIRRSLKKFKIEARP